MKQNGVRGCSAAYKLILDKGLQYVKIKQIESFLASVRQLV